MGLPLIYGKGMGAIGLGRPQDPAYGVVPDALIGAVPPRASLADKVFIPPGWTFPDQESNGECVGWMLTQLVHVRTTILGHSIAMSPGGVYYGARARKYGWRSIWDGGCNPNEAFEHSRECGLIPYNKWPHSTGTVNKHPPPGCYRSAADRKWLLPRWVFQQLRTDVVKSLIANGFPVGVALRVDEALYRWKAGDYPWYRKGPIAGGHAVTIVGYDTFGLKGDKTAFVVANSWGPIHDHGFFLLSEEALESSETSYVCTVDIDEGRLT